MPDAQVIFSTGSLYPCDLSYAFEVAADAGFDGIELMADHRYSTRDPLYLQRLSTHTGLPIRVVHTPFSAALPGWDRADDPVQVIRSTLSLAETLGAHAIVVHLPLALPLKPVRLGKRRFFLPRRNPFDAVKRWMIHELAQVQAKTSVKIAIENLPRMRVWGRRVNHSHWNTIPEWSRVHDWLTLDTTHCGANDEDPLAAYRAARGRVANVHLSNYDGKEHRLPHRGNLDLVGFLGALKADAYAGTVSLELHPDALDYTSDVALRQHLRDSRAFIREHSGL